MRNLTDVELTQLSFPHHDIAFHHLIRDEDEYFSKAGRVCVDFSLEDRLLRFEMQGAGLKTDEMHFLGRGWLEISGWDHLEVLRRFPQVGWATETRNPPNLIGYIHSMKYIKTDKATGVHIMGIGRTPAAYYFYVIENPVVKAAFEDTIENQQELNEQYLVNFQQRREELASNPRDAALRMPLDEEDAGFLQGIIQKQQRIKDGNDNG